MTPRNEKSATEPWVKGTKKVVIPKKEGAKKKATHAPTKIPPATLKSVMAKLGRVYAECKAFANKLKKGK